MVVPSVLPDSLRSRDKLLDLPVQNENAALNVVEGRHYWLSRQVFPSRFALAYVQFFKFAEGEETHNEEHGKLASPSGHLN
jgi:hypothetical protein